MNEILRSHADAIISAAISAVKPDAAVRRALEGKHFPGRVILVSVGKAAWQMAKAARDTLGERILGGIVITKYGHVMGDIEGIICREAGHPLPDANGYAATEEALKMMENLTEEDTVLFLLSGGGSALFEKPLLAVESMEDITRQLLACGANIVEINTIRKRLSGVKGGRFALHCAPAQLYCIVLSDVLGDPLDMIASGPACPDSSSCAEALSIAEKYALRLDDAARARLNIETPKKLENVHTQITGSVRQLCLAAMSACRKLGYEPVLLTDRLCCEAREAGSFLASILKSHASEGKNIAFLAGGETIVHLRGNGLGGRNQELALAAAAQIDGCKNMALFSVGSDGTDGPTDAAGGYVDGDTAAQLRLQGIDLHRTLENNDAYHALERTGGLIFTGPTGTNVNDVAIALLHGRD